MMYDMNDIFRLDPDELPASIQNLQDCPKILYAVGDFSLLDSPCISVAGSRKIDKASSQWLDDVISRCSGYTIVSGLALGADTVAHKSALKYGLPTIAVLPSGINNIAPQRNEKLADKIINNGGLVISEYPLHSKPNRDTYIGRNRLIATLGKYLIIPQCDKHSGTMYTARFAKDYNKHIVTRRADYSGNQYIISNKKFKTFIK